MKMPGLNVNFTKVSRKSEEKKLGIRYPDCQGGKKMEWLKKLGEAIDYLEAHLDKDLSYQEAARIACCSPEYFQRIFSYIAGVSLSEYIRRRKMTQAAFELQQTNSRVIDVAVKYGYSSPTSFNRAFQKVHGIKPMTAKNMGCTLCAYPALKFSVQVSGDTPISYHIEEKDLIRIVGFKTPLVENMEANMKHIPLFWKQAWSQNQIGKLAKLSDGNPDGILGVSIYSGPKNFYYYIAVSTDAPALDNMAEYTIPKATWAVFENSGQFKEDVQSVFRRFLTEFLPLSGYVYAGLPDIEVYPFSTGQPASGQSQVWIAIKKAKEV